MRTFPNVIDRTRIFSKHFQRAAYKFLPYQIFLINSNIQRKLKYTSKIMRFVFKMKQKIKKLTRRFAERLICCRSQRATSYERKHFSAGFRGFDRFAKSRFWRPQSDEINYALFYFARNAFSALFPHREGKTLVFPLLAKCSFREKSALIRNRK